MSGGLRAATAIKPVLTALRMVPATDYVSVTAFSRFMADNGEFRASRAGRGRRENHARRVASAEPGAPAAAGNELTGAGNRRAGRLTRAVTSPEGVASYGRERGYKGVPAQWPRSWPRFAAGTDLLHVTVHSGRRAVDFYLRDGTSHHRQLLLWEPAAP